MDQSKEHVWMEYESEATGVYFRLEGEDCRRKSMKMMGQHSNVMGTIMYSLNRGEEDPNGLYGHFLFLYTASDST